MSAKGNCSAATDRRTPILVDPCNGAVLKAGQRSYPFLTEDANRASTTTHPQIELTSTPPTAGVLPVTPGIAPAGASIFRSSVVVVHVR